eukprot:7257743-Prymnesium_polylepis.1
MGTVDIPAGTVDIPVGTVGVAATVGAMEGRVRQVGEGVMAGGHEMPHSTKGCCNPVAPISPGTEMETSKRFTQQGTRFTQ